MKQIRKRLTYANVMSSIAVFLVLGGATALAASGLAKNSVGTKQLKKNSVTSAKIKKNAITTAKVKNAAITGAKVNLATLGTVPSATNATNAANAANATHASHAASVDGLLVFPTKRVNANANLASSQKIELGSRGPFNFYARCYDEAGRTEAIQYIEVASGNATFGTEGGDSLESLTPSTPESERELNSESANPNSINDNGTDSDFRAASTDVAITGNIGLAMAKNGTPATGDGPFLPGDSCIFGGVVFG